MTNLRKLTPLPNFTHWHLGKCDYPVYKLEIELDHAVTLEQLNAKHEMRRTKMPKTEMSKEFLGKARRDAQRWDEYTTGNAYVLYVQNRTGNHSFRVIKYGKNVFQAVRRYYRGLDNGDSWQWHCTKVVAVYSCASLQQSQSGDLLYGQPQKSYPW